MQKFLLASLVCISACQHGYAQKWKFVVAGDGRSDSRSTRPQDESGVNAVITSEIARAVVAEDAKFLAWTGDLIIGYQKKPEDQEKQLRYWLHLMKPLTDRKIKILATRGNHDAGGTDADQVWRKVFAGEVAMPNNGPAGEEGMTFSYETGNVLMIGLDQYQAKKETVNQEWLDKVLAKNKKPFIFSFGHEPAFMDGAHKDTLDADPVRRDAFWKSLVKSGSRVYFCGHDHLYDHMTVVENGSKPGPEMHQLVAGTAGAPFYDPGAYNGQNTIWKLNRVKNISNTYGYIVVEIDGNKATITFKGRKSPGVYVPMDSFSYEVPRKSSHGSGHSWFDN